MTTIAPSIFDQHGLHVVHLGALAQHEGDDVLTFTDRATRQTRTFSFPKDSFDFLNSLDPTVADRDFTAGERALLLELANDHAVKFVREEAGLEDLDFVPVPRTTFTPVGETEDGYVIRPGSGGDFILSAVGINLLGLSDGVRTLREVLEDFRAQVFADPEAREMAEADAASEGRTFEALLLDEGLQYLKATAASAAVTVEPTSRVES